MLENDFGCSKNSNITVSVLLTTCTDDEFTCEDGFCINMMERCNKIINCPMDSSDEDSCFMINFDRTYKKEFAPATTDELKNIIRTKVIVSIDLLTILKIDEVDSTFSCQLKLHLLWYDQRLTYNNLKHDSNYNSLSGDERNRIWTPNIIFFNTEKMDGLKSDERAHASLLVRGNYTLASDDKLHNAFLYEGSENPISLNRAYKVDFICNFDMMWYPFDIQHCFMNICMEGNGDIFVELLPGDIIYDGPIDLSQYFIRNKDISKDGDIVAVRFSLGRRLLSTFLTTYVPTLLLNIIALSTNYFKVRFA